MPIVILKLKSKKIFIYLANILECITLTGRDFLKPVLH